jgi:hypothetical protein
MLEVNQMSSTAPIRVIPALLVGILRRFTVHTRAVAGTVAREKEEDEEMIERFARKGLMRAIISAGALASALAFTAPAMAQHHGL